MNSHQWLGSSHTACKCTSGHGWIHANHGCGCDGGGSGPSRRARFGGARASSAVPGSTGFGVGASVGGGPSAAPFRAAPRSRSARSAGLGGSPGSQGAGMRVGEACCCDAPRGGGPAGPSTPGPTGPSTPTPAGPSTPGPQRHSTPTPAGPRTPGPGPRTGGVPAGSSTPFGGGPATGRPQPMMPGGNGPRTVGPITPTSYYRCVGSGAQRGCEYCGTTRHAGCSMTPQECHTQCRPVAQASGGGVVPGCPSVGRANPMHAGCRCPGTIRTDGRCDCSANRRTCEVRILCGTIRATYHAPALFGVLGWLLLPSPCHCWVEIDTCDGQPLRYDVWQSDVDAEKARSRKATKIGKHLYEGYFPHGKWPENQDSVFKVFSAKFDCEAVAESRSSLCDCVANVAKGYPYRDTYTPVPTPGLSPIGNSNTFVGYVALKCRIAVDGPGCAIGWWKATEMDFLAQPRRSWDKLI